MRNHLRILAAEIRNELANLDRLQDELAELLRLEVADNPSSTSVRAMGSVVHDFYSGVEKVFRRIALDLDAELPGGDDWQADLLRRMTVIIPDVRPAAISRDLAEIMAEYMRFRHLFRNIYGFQLRWERFSHLALGVQETLRRFRAETCIFLQFLEDVGQSG
ncbi:MAG TPA: hypothetical protein VLK32_01470 [Bacillota bacterium]|nr:hypothetical protein [Bacillota bacterium]